MLAEFAYLGAELAYQVVVKNPNQLAAEIESIRPIPEAFQIPPRSPGPKPKFAKCLTGAPRSFTVIRSRP